MFQRQPFVWRVGMQWKLTKRDGDVVRCSNAFNTNRTEVAPWSDVVRKDFEVQLRHVGCPVFGAKCEFVIIAKLSLIVLQLPVFIKKVGSDNPSRRDVRGRLREVDDGPVGEFGILK